MKRTLVLGAAFVDVLMNVPRLPLSGEDVTGNWLGNQIGGSAFNVFGALQYAHQPADLGVPVGQGSYADQINRFLKQHDLATLFEVDGKDNGWDLAMVEPNGERTFLTVPGIEQGWRPEWFEQVEMSQYDAIYLSGYEMENVQAANVILDQLKKRRSDSVLLFDASPRIAAIDDAIIKQLKAQRAWFHCNGSELNQLTRQADLPNRVSQLTKETQSPVIVTLGNRGAFVMTNQMQTGELVPADSVPVVNTIGAGDTHCGGLLAGLNQGMAIKGAVAFANQLAGRVVQLEAGTLLSK